MNPYIHFNSILAFLISSIAITAYMASAVTMLNALEGYAGVDEFYA